MFDGPGRIPKSDVRLGLMTVVPSDDKRATSLSAAIRRITDQIDPPLGFKIFNRVEFTTCEKLAKVENQALLRDAIKELKKRILRSPNYLASASENFRVIGVQTVIFTFKLSVRGVALNLTGKTDGLADVETGNIPLIATRRR